MLLLCYPLEEDLHFCYILHYIAPSTSTRWQNPATLDVVPVTVSYQV